MKNSDSIFLICACICFCTFTICATQCTIRDTEIRFQERQQKAKP